MTPGRTAWRIDRAGSLARLRLVDEPLAAPAAGEARVRVRAVGLNFADIFACLGLYSATPAGTFVPGLEVAGVVEALGPGTENQTDLRPGDAVVALTRFGGYATALNVGVGYLHRAPEGWTAAEAAAWPVQGLTAWYGLLPLGAIAAGDRVLVQSAAGGVGLQALDIVRAVGARAIAVVGREDKRRFLVEHRGLEPAAVVLRVPGRAFAAALDAAIAATGGTGFDCVLDAVLGGGFRIAFDRLRPEGRYVLYGAADFMTTGTRPNPLALAWRYLRRPRLDPLAMISANRSLLAFNLIWLWEQADRLPDAFAALAALSPRPPHVSAVLPFEEAPRALRLLQGGGTVGKVVLEIA